MSGIFFVFLHIILCVKTKYMVNQQNFALIGAAGYIAPRHIKAIADTGNNLMVAYDKFDSVGRLDSSFPDCSFFTENEQFDRFCSKQMRTDNPLNWLSVCTPNYTHDAFIRYGLRLGLNVICEKPFCLNQKQARDLLSCALSNGVYVFENMKVYHSLAYKQLKKDIDLIKPIKNVTLNFSRLSSVYDKFKYNLNQTALSLSHGSGALMDINCYNVSFVVGLFGLPKKSTYFANKTNGIDTSGVAILDYDGFIVNLIVIS